MQLKGRKGDELPRNGPSVYAKSSFPVHLDRRFSHFGCSAVVQLRLDVIVVLFVLVALGRRQNVACLGIHHAPSSIRTSQNYQSALAERNPHDRPNF